MSGTVHPANHSSLTQLPVRTPSELTLPCHSAAARGLPDVLADLPGRITRLVCAVPRPAATLPSVRISPGLRHPLAVAASCLYERTMAPESPEATSSAFLVGVVQDAAFNDSVIHCPISSSQKEGSRRIPTRPLKAFSSHGT